MEDCPARAKLPEKFEFDPNAVDDVLTLLSGLNAERIAGSKDTPVTADWQKTWLVELTSDKDEKIHVFATKTKANKEEFLVRGNIDSNVYIVKALRLSSLNAGVNAFKKEEFDLPPIDENTKGFESLPVDIQRKLLNVTKEKK
jgi:ABC-type microcin C transport system permease subunit YejE